DRGQQVLLQAGQCRRMDVQQPCLQSRALVRKRLVGSPIALEAFGITIGRKCAHQRQIAPLDLVIAGVFINAESGEWIQGYHVGSSCRDRGMSHLRRKLSTISMARLRIAAGGNSSPTSEFFSLLATILTARALPPVATNWRICAGERSLTLASIISAICSVKLEGPALAGASSKSSSESRKSPISLTS